MEGRSVYLRVGLLILTGLVLLIALIWFLAGSQISRGTVLETYFSESVQGLEVGTAVKYRGVTIGRVNEIGLVNAEYGGNRPMEPESDTYRLVFVRYVVDTTKIGQVPDVDAAVALGLRARLASQGITGLSYLELDFVDPQRYPAQKVPWKPKAQYIPSMPSTFTQVQDAAQELLAKLNGVDIDRLVTQFNGLLTDLRTSLANGDVHQALTQAESLLRTTHEQIQAADLPGLTRDIRQTSAALRGTLAGEQMQKLLANAGLAADRLATAAARLPALIAAAQTTMQRAGNGTADVEQNLVPLLRDIRAAAQSLREMTEALRRYPGQVFAQPPPRSPELAR